MVSSKPAVAIGAKINPAMKMITAQVFHVKADSSLVTASRNRESNPDRLLGRQGLCH